MKRDFTLSAYGILLRTLKDEGYNFLRVRDYLSEKSSVKYPFVILRHDVDQKPKNSLNTAILENQFSINATYYFRILDCSFDVSVIKKIVNLGHEFGYHYEDLTLAHGDYTEALRLFEKHLEKFREIGNVSTICMHGSPLSKWDNRDLWNKYDFDSFGLIGEPYLDINFNEVFYLTDTGRKWNHKIARVRDKVSQSHQFELYSASTWDLVRLAKAGKLPKQIMINTHPQRWNENIYLWTIELVSQSIKNIAKYILTTIRN